MSEDDRLRENWQQCYARELASIGPASTAPSQPHDDIAFRRDGDRLVLTVGGGAAAFGPDTLRAIARVAWSAALSIDADVAAARDKAVSDRWR